MTILPIASIASGLQKDGYWIGTPSLVIQVMDHPLATVQPGPVDPAYPLPDYDIDQQYEVSLNRLLNRRGSSPHYAYVGPTTLAELALSYRERHIVLIGRELGRHDVGTFARLVLNAGRSVQIETTAMAPSLLIPDAWISLITLPSRETTSEFAPENADRPNEVLASIRWRSDLDRTEHTYANRKMSVWLRPSTFAEENIHRQCIAVAARHIGWHVAIS